MQRRPGYTTIELMTATAVLAIVAALSIPGVQQFRQTIALRNAADDLVGVLRTAQTAAISAQRGASHGVVFDAANNTYTLYWLNGAAEQQIATYSIPTGINLQGSGQIRVVFDRLDGLLVGSTSPITIAAGSQTKTVSVSTLGDITSS